MGLKQIITRLKGRDSSEEEQGFRKAQAVGSIPTLGSTKRRPIPMRRRYSRKAKIETRRNIRRTVLYIISAILVIAILFFFGLNLLIKYAGFFMDIDSSDTPIEVEDTTPPPPPRLRSYEDVTNQEDIEIRGNTESGAKVRLLINNREEEVLANNEGQFSYTFELNKGKNQFSAIAIDSSGNESTESDTVSIVYDDQPPDLEIIKPSDGQDFYGAENRQINIEGQTEDDARVSINGKWAVVDNQGKFSYLVSLEDGENIFEIISTDKAGNQSEAELAVNFTP